MEEQLSFELTHARRTDPATSKAAARAAERFASSHCGRILACLKAHGPQTVDEIAARIGLQPHQINKRLPDLYYDRLAAPTGLVGTSNSGRQERLWTAL